MATMTPNALALQYKADLEATGAFVVEPDGRVRFTPDRGGGYVPPWSWAGAIPPASGDDPQSQALRIKLSTPASDPSSPWRDSVGYDAGGPFSKHSQWDSKTGTYQGGIDWGTLLGTIGVGAMFAAPALAGAFGSGGATAASAAGGAGEVDAAAEAAMAAEAAGGTGAAATVAPLTATSTIPAGTIGTLYGAPSATVPVASTVPATGAMVPATTASMTPSVAAKGAGVGSNIWGQIINAGMNLFGAKTSADASERAAQIQADAATKAAQLAYQSGKDTLDFQKSSWNTTQRNMAPFLGLGQSGARTLGQLMGLSPTGSGSVPIRPRGQAMPSTPSTMGNMYQTQPGAPAPAQPAPNTPAYVRIAWPDGHQDTVPQNSLEQYKLLGAQVK